MRHVFNMTAIYLPSGYIAACLPNSKPLLFQDVDRSGDLGVLERFTGTPLF